MKPSDDPKADQLVNSNISQPSDQQIYPEEQYVDEDSDVAFDGGDTGYYVDSNGYVKPKNT